jgi:hypothetical protein
MSDIRTYQIEAWGPLDAKDLNSSSPIQITVLPVENETPLAATLLIVCTDQSGLIGLLRHLHGRGITLLSVRREG